MIVVFSTLAEQQNKLITHAIHILILSYLTYQFPHTGKAAYHDTLTSGSTTQDN